MKTTTVVGAVLGAIIRVLAVVAVVYLIYEGSVICYDYGFRIFTEPAMTTEERARTVRVTITSDMSAFDIGELFEDKGLVRDAKLFALQYYLSEYLKDVEPGVFELNTSMTAEDMMAAMVKIDPEAEED
ncbi:MAG: endolytic transglycosylase MltG [Lachnospiraceae bacterium]|nr:endolytic transglycosylase MltG [Lachnospiraceae bacterium]